MHVRDRVVVITGGAHGIGGALARRFAAEGAAHVAVLDLDGDGARAVAAEIDGSAHAVDVADARALETALADVAASHGRIDLMCSNAGVGLGGGLETSDDAWARLWQINVHSHIVAARAVLPAMLERGSGYLLSTASAAGLLTNIGAFPYSVTKHAAVAVAEWLSVTYGSRGIGVSCLCPMGVDTQLVADSGALRALLEPAMISVNAVAEVTIAGLRDESFLILPHPEVGKFLRHKATDPDRWLAAMRQLQEKLGLGPI